MGGWLTAFPITPDLNNRGLYHPRETRRWDGRLGKGNKRLIVFHTSELCRWLLYSRWDFNLGFYWKKKCISQPEWPKPSGVVFFFFFLNAALDTLFLFFFSLVIIGFTTGNIQSGNKYRAPKRVKCCWHCDVANGALGTQCCCWLGLVWEQLKP